MCFLWPRWSDFTIIFSPDVYSTFFRLVFFVNSPKNACKWRFCIFFFICMMMSKERLVRVFIGKHLSLRGREVKVTVFLIDCPPRLTLVLGGSLTGQVQLRCWWKFNSPLVQLGNLVNDPPKTVVKAGRGVQENTRQYREAKEANVVCLVFLTNISTNFLNLIVGDRPVGLVHWKRSHRYFSSFKKTS